MNNRLVALIAAYLVFGPLTYSAQAEPPALDCKGVSLASQLPPTSTVRTVTGTPDELRCYGAMVTVTLTNKASGKSTQVLAQIDTGADLTFVRQKIMTDLGAKPTDVVEVHAGSNNELRNAGRYLGIDVELIPGAAIPTVILSAPDTLFEPMLIGRSLLRFYKVTYDGPASTVRIELPNR